MPRPLILLPGRLENDLPGKLYEAWIVELPFSGDLTEAGRSKCVRRWNELGPVEEVEEFSAKFKSKPLIGPERGVLKSGKVPVGNSVRLQRRIDAGFVSKGIGRWCGEAGRIDPAVTAVKAVLHPGLSASARRLIATSNNIGPQIGAIRADAVVGRIADVDRKTALKRCHSVDAPAAKDLVG